MTGASIEQFAKAHLDELIALVAAEGWAEYGDDVEQTYRALTAPGVTTLVAIVDGRVAGAIQVQSDGLCGWEDPAQLPTAEHELSPAGVHSSASSTV